MWHDIQVWLGATVVTLAVLPLAKKAINAYINRDFKLVLDKSMTLDQVTDPVLRKKLVALSHAAVDVMEYVTPNRGEGQLGAAKFAKADAALAAIPLLANAAGIRKALIEIGCDAMWTADDAMKNSLDGHPPLM